MDNSNFWDWENEDEHRVSSVYRDAAEENITSQTDAGHNAEKRTDVIHNIVQNVSEEQTTAVPPEAAAENNFILVDTPQNTAQNITPQAEPSHTQTEYQQNHPDAGYQSANNQPANNQPADNQQTAYQQTDSQQNNFQQIIPVQNTQQNQGANRQKTKQNRNVDYSSDFDQKDISENKVSAMTAYLLGPVGIIIALLIARDSAYTAFHVRQALKITICSVVLEIIAAVLGLFAMIPLVGIIFKLVLVIISAIWLGVLALRLIAVAQVCDGEAREPAIIGKMNCFH